MDAYDSNIRIMKGLLKDGASPISFLTLMYETLDAIESDIASANVGINRKGFKAGATQMVEGLVAVLKSMEQDKSA